MELKEENYINKPKNGHYLSIISHYVMLPKIAKRSCQWTMAYNIQKNLDIFLMGMMRIF